MKAKFKILYRLKCYPDDVRTDALYLHGLRGAVTMRLRKLQRHLILDIFHQD